MVLATSVFAQNRFNQAFSNNQDPTSQNNNANNNVPAQNAPSQRRGRPNRGSRFQGQQVIQGGGTQAGGSSAIKAKRNAKEHVKTIKAVTGGKMMMRCPKDARFDRQKLGCVCIANNLNPVGGQCPPTSCPTNQKVKGFACVCIIDEQPPTAGGTCKQRCWNNTIAYTCPERTTGSSGGGIVRASTTGNSGGGDTSGPKDTGSTTGSSGGGLSSPGAGGEIKDDGPPTMKDPKGLSATKACAKDYHVRNAQDMCEPIIGTNAACSFNSQSERATCYAKKSGANAYMSKTGLWSKANKICTDNSYEKADGTSDADFETCASSNGTSVCHIMKVDCQNKIIPCEGNCKKCKDSGGSYSHSQSKCTCPEHHDFVASTGKCKANCPSSKPAYNSTLKVCQTCLQLTQNPFLKWNDYHKKCMQKPLCITSFCTNCWNTGGTLEKTGGFGSTSYRCTCGTGFNAPTYLSGSSQVRFGWNGCNIP